MQMGFNQFLRIEGNKYNTINYKKIAAERS